MTTKTANLLADIIRDKIREADISNEDWVRCVLDDIPTEYAKGYLTGRLEVVRLPYKTEKFRRKFLNLVNELLFY